MDVYVYVLRVFNAYGYAGHMTILQLFQSPGVLYIEEGTTNNYNPSI